MEVTELGMVIDVNRLQSENALSPMEVTELGMLIDVNPLQSENALDPMEVTLLPIAIVVIWLHGKTDLNLSIA